MHSVLPDKKQAYRQGVGGKGEALESFPRLTLTSSLSIFLKQNPVCSQMSQRRKKGPSPSPSQPKIVRNQDESCFFFLCFLFFCICLSFFSYQLLYQFFLFCFLFLSCLIGYFFRSFLSFDFLLILFSHNFIILWVQISTTVSNWIITLYCIQQLQY